MASVLTEDLVYEILSAVEEIPKGKVASYGQKALLDAEGVAFRDDTHVDMKKCQWDCR